MGGNARKLGTAYSARWAAYPLGGKLRLNKARLKAEARLKGKYLVSTTDDYLSIQDVVAGYRQLAQIERVFRDERVAAYHWLADRIRAHVPLCCSHFAPSG